MQLQGEMPGEPQILLPVFSGANSNESKFQLESQGEEVHPYMSLYYPLFAAHVESHVESQDRVEPNSTQSSYIRKRPVNYATRIYDVDAEPQKATISKKSGTELAVAIQDGPRKETSKEKELSAKTLSSNTSSGKNLLMISPSSKTGEHIIPDKSLSSHLQDEQSYSRKETNGTTKKTKNKKERRKKKRSSSKTNESITPDENLSSQAPFAPQGLTTVETRPLQLPNKSHKIRKKSISEGHTEIVKKKRKRAMAADPMNRRIPKRKRKPNVFSDSDESSSSLGNEKIDEHYVGKKPTASPNVRNSKRQRNSKPMQAVPNEDKKSEEYSKNNISEQDDTKSLQLVEMLNRRYPKRKRDPTAFLVNNKNDSVKSSRIQSKDKNDIERNEEYSKNSMTKQDEYYSDSDEDEFEDTDENLNYSDSDDDDDDEDSKPYRKSKAKKSGKKDTIPIRKRRKVRNRKPQEIYPNGRYGVDYEKLAKEKYIDDYKKDIKTDNGEYKDRNWNMRFQEYLAYWRKYKTHHIKGEKKFRHLRLWAQVQRTVFKCKQMHPDRFRRLHSIGFAWKRDCPTWMESFQKLVAYKEKHGHANVPKRYKEDPHLGLWCRHNRAIYNHQRYILEKERVLLLESIGFKWVVTMYEWMKRFKELSDFKKKHGHFNVPSDYPNRLALWVRLRREEFARSSLPSEQILKLDTIGFDYTIEPK